MNHVHYPGMLRGLARSELLRSWREPALCERPMQGLADGYFVLPCTVPDDIASTPLDPVDVSNTAFAESKAGVKNRFKKLVAIKGNAAPIRSTAS